MGTDKFHVSKIDWAGGQTPEVYQGHSTDFRRSTYVDRYVGYVHMGVGVCSLEEAGSIQLHVHSFEESFYILEGRLVGLMGENAHTFGLGDFGLISTGVEHGFRNAWKQTALWLEMQAPQSRTAESNRDTFFIERNLPKQAAPIDMGVSAAASF